ncbi:E3 ubiquitin-protein ligase RNF12-like [Prunus yedoensis var. nudiflora]|uniref:RING-type E3 ubiquitin transferase n=1 Tax=Prunus yedoensis var. nudiflora TaxID=2094558 RepID=A0A314V028_PRUYE|nr:E3 ubiquitin-protein ligase RNF12-like [Prunus yedoensis var. nudiflora]
MASESWKVVGETYCKAWLQQALEPENESLPCTKFLMDAKATVRQCLLQQPIDFNEDISLFLEDDNWSVDEYEDTVETLANNPFDLATVISQTLARLQVPSHAHQDMIDTIILPEAFKAARSIVGRPRFCVSRCASMLCCDKNYMEEEFGGTDVLEVADDDGSDQPAFVPASRAFIEKLERARVVELSTMCSICMEDIAVGSEATRMPCSHFYHEGCIVEWLQKSRFCPLCRYSPPADHD